MNDILKNLLEALTPEQKQKLTDDLLSSQEEEASDTGSSKPPPHPKVKEDFSVNRKQKGKSRKKSSKVPKESMDRSGRRERY